MRLSDIRAIRYGDVLVEGERWPGFLHVVEHPQGRVLVDTGLIDSTPELDEEWSPRFDSDAIPRDVVCVINTHLHFDHCGGNRLFADPRRDIVGGVVEAVCEVEGEGTHDHDDEERRAHSLDLPVLHDDRLEHVRRVFARVHGLLKALVDVLPPDHRERVSLRQEEGRDAVVEDPIAHVLELT
jgi:glyoxylase-like metal-dependent hydrolase (beta-lactamase superfamily II)